MGYRRSLQIGAGILIIVLAISILTFCLSMGPCPEGTFPCDNGSVCVPQRQICDSRIDCNDESDENPVECGILYGSTELIGNLTVAYQQKMNESIEFNDTARFDEIPCAIQTYPDACNCDQGRMLGCDESAELTSIPYISSEVTYLLIINSNLTLEKDSLKGLNLQYLKLKNNNISNLPEGFLSEQCDLTKLYLHFNKIENIYNGSFLCLKQLKWLFLNSNRLNKLPMDDLKELQNLQVLNVSSNFLTLHNEQFPKLNKIYEIFLDDNLIERIEESTFAQIMSLHLLSLSSNKIYYIHPRAFWSLTNLKDIRLTGNPIKFLSNEVLAKTTQLDAVYLGNTKLTITDAITKYLNCSYLNLDHIPFDKIDFTSIGQIKNLKYIVYQKFYFCSMTPNVEKCKPNTDGVSSFTDMLTKPVLRYSAWMMATVTIVGNLLVMWGRFHYRDENPTVTIVIRNLAMSDILMGFYLFIIGIQDFRYRNIYHEVAMDWITSWHCAAIGVLAVISSEVSMLILAFMSLERFLLIANPFHVHINLTSYNISYSLWTIWACGGVIAMAPMILWRSSTKYYGTFSGTCFPLHIQERYPLGWEYSAFIFLGLNFFLLIMIALLYTALLISIWRTRRATPLALMDCEFAVRFFFIVLTDVLCWAPIIFTKFWAFFSYDISEDTYAWLVVFILPLNSAVNPLLYTLTTPKYRNEILVRGWNSITLRRRTQGSATGFHQDDSVAKVIPLFYNENKKDKKWDI